MIHIDQPLSPIILKSLALNFKHARIHNVAEHIRRPTNGSILRPFIAFAWKYVIGENIANDFKPGIATDKVVTMNPANTKIPVAIAADNLEGIIRLKKSAKVAKKRVTAKTE